MLRVSCLFSFQFRFISTKMKVDSLVAVCQMRSTADPDENMATVETLIREAAAAGAKMVFLPEACDYLGTSPGVENAKAEPLDGPRIKRYCQIAAEAGVWVSLGGLHRSVTGDSLPRNSHIVLNQEGTIAAIYDKAHLFDADPPDGGKGLRESSYTRAGKTPVPVVDTPAGRLAPAICYDLRFPEVAMTARIHGASIIAFPSAFTHATGALHWEVLLRARAIESQCWIVAAAQTGLHGNGRKSWGHALIASPDGTIVAQVPPGLSSSFALARIEHSLLESVRSTIPLASHRRPDLYTLPSASIPINDQVEPQKEFPFGTGVVPVEVVFAQSTHSFAFVNRKPVVPGHVVISTRRPEPLVSGLSAAESADLFSLACRTESAIRSAFSAPSTVLAVQNGPEAGQTVPQVHFHVLPRRPGDFARNDDVYTALQTHDATTDNFRSLAEMAAEAELLRSFMDSS